MRVDAITLVDITKQYVNRYTVVYFMSASPIKITSLFKFRQGSNRLEEIPISLYRCFFYWQCIYNNHLIFKKILQTNPMNWQSVLLNVPIDKHVGLTSNNKTHKRQLKYHILAVSCISNENNNANIMNMINIDIQHRMIINRWFPLQTMMNQFWLTMSRFTFTKFVFLAHTMYIFRPEQKQRWYK